MTPDRLRTGDILLFRGNTIVGKAICFLTRSTYCHAAMIGLNGKVLDMYDLSGGRASEVESLAGYRVDVFRLWRRIGDYPAVTGRAAAIMAEDVATAKYSLFHAILAGSRLCSRRFRKECNRHGLHCSQAVSKAYREAGVDLCPAVIDLTTLPDHLALSPFLVGVGRLEF